MKLQAVVGRGVASPAGIRGWKSATLLPPQLFHHLHEGPSGRAPDRLPQHEQTFRAMDESSGDELLRALRAMVQNPDVHPADVLEAWANAGKDTIKEALKLIGKELKQRVRRITAVQAACSP